MTKLLFHTGRARGPNRAKDPITRAMVDMIDRSGYTDKFVADRAGVAVVQMMHYRAGNQTPGAATVAWILGALGASFRVEDDNEVVRLPLSLNQMRALRA